MEAFIDYDYWETGDSDSEMFRLDRRSRLVERIRRDDYIPSDEKYHQLLTTTQLY